MSFKTGNLTKSRQQAGIDRRQFVKLAGAGALAAGSGILAAPAVHAAKSVRIGFVSPQTGPISFFADPDQYILGQMAKVFADGVKIGGKSYPVEIITKDSQSNPNRAAEVAAGLILGDEVDLLVAANTPVTTNPVADQAELNGVPCITTDTPWQPHFFGRRGDPKTGFEWTSHFFWGLEDVVEVYTNLWNSLDSNKSVGALFPNDEDGNAWGGEHGFPPVLKAQGYALADPGRYQPFSDDFTAQIAAFKAADCQIVTGVVPPPDFTNFWLQAGQQNFHPKMVTVGKALEWPATAAALGERAGGLSVEVWWSPAHPFSSGMTGQSSKDLADGFTQATGKPWNVSVGFKHALFEVAYDVLKRAEEKSPEAIRDAIRATDYKSIVGEVNFSKGPVPGVGKTPLVGGQWQKNAKGGHDLMIVNNKSAPFVPVNAEFRPMA